MMQALAPGSVLGLFSGMLPGPFSGLVAATAMDRGLRSGLKLALVPLVTEGLVLAVTAVVVSQLPRHVLRWTGMAGGMVVLYMAWRTFKEAQRTDRGDAAYGEVRKVGEAVAMGLLSPDPWVFWLLVGSPLCLSQWRQGWGSGLMFFGAFVVLLVGLNIAWAGLAAYGHRELGPIWRRRLMRGAIVLFAVAGGVLIWQSWIGNFQEMVAGSEAVVEEVEEGVS